MSKPPSLTTTFTPSPSCTLYQYATSKTINYASSGEPPDYGPNLVVNLGPPVDPSSCFPSGWATGPTAYFSPGICPDGYTSACSTLSSLAPITSGETTVICCPSDYTCGTYYDYPWICTSSYIGDVDTVLDLYTAGTKSGSYTALFGGVNALSVQIRYQATDFVSTTASNPVSTTTGNSYATGAVTDTRSSGLSTGAKAGIGVGVAIGVLGLLLLGALFLRRRKTRIGQAPVLNRTPYGLDAKPELDGTFYARPKVEDAGPSVAELDGPEAHSDPMRTRDPIASGSFAAGSVGHHTPANIASTDPSPLGAPHTRSQDAVELPSQAASEKTNSNVTHPQELADSVPETRSAAPVPREARPGEVEGEAEIQRQIQRIREEKQRLTRINELEREEAELRERLARPTTTVELE